MKKETYICNGKRFSSYEQVEKHCDENNLRVTNTITVNKNTFIIEVLSVNHAEMVKS